MINHVKTLLLNEHPTVISPVSALSPAPLPPEYRVRTLTGVVGRAYDAVFNADCDLTAKLMRLRTVLPAIFGPDLSAFTLGRDDRVIYGPVDTYFLDIGLNQPVTEADVHVSKRTAINTTSQCYFESTITRSGASEVLITGRDGPTTHEIAISDGYSNYFDVPGGFLCAIPDISVGQTRNFKVVRPLRDPLGVLIGRVARFDAASELFNGFPEASALSELFSTSMSAMTRFGAFCLALAFKIEDE